MIGNAVDNQSDEFAQADLRNIREAALAALHSRATRAEKLLAQQELLVGMFAELLNSRSLQGALDAFAGTLKKQFNCDRVAIALARNGELQLTTVSQQAVLQASSSEARLLVNALREACDQESVVCWPLPSGNPGVLVAHRALAGRRQTASICSVPMFDKQELVGGFLLEQRDKSEFPVLTLERLSLCLAPLLVLHGKADRSWWTVLQNSLRVKLGHYFGRERPGMRLLGVLSAMLVVGSLVMTTQWQIVAPAELLSHERRLITSPVAGFVADIQVAAGDQVTKGQLLAQLDRREMELEAASRDSEVVMAEAEFRAALASYDRQSTGIARARLTQARARREVVEQQLIRTDLVSPIDGLVTSFDATVSSGTAVSRGEILFEIAPGTDFEVHVLVDEADVYDVHEGQTGMLSLKAMPGEKLPIIVESVYPVAEAKDGQNRFRIRASLINSTNSLHPGQSGVVRLDAGRTSIMGALTRQVNRRLSALWWRWVG